MQRIFPRNSQFVAHEGKLYYEALQLQYPQEGKLFIRRLQNKKEIQKQEILIGIIEEMKIKAISK